MLPLPFYLLRVVDLTTSDAGAYATRVFADLGAEVIKVEDANHAAESRTAPGFESLNRNKLSLALAPASSAGRALCLRLAGISDFVFIDAPGAAIGYDELITTREDVIVISIGAAHDAMAGLIAAGGALAALFHRRTTGEGQLVEAGAPNSSRAAQQSTQALKSLDVGLLREHGFFETIGRGDGSIVETDGVPYRFSRTPAHIRLPAPAPGQHNDYVLRAVLGLEDGEVEALKAPHSRSP